MSVTDLTKARIRRILVCGSRDYTNRERVRAVLDEYIRGWPHKHDAFEVIHGAARGADTLAGEEALDLGFWVRAVPAQWRRYDKRAGIIRNRTMLDLEPDLVIAFGDGRGTSDTVAEAERRGIPVRREQ